MIQPIYLYGADVLRRKAEEIDITDKKGVKALVQDLKDTLAEAEGCGLAAPQIGVSKRVVIVDGTDMTDMYDYLKDFRRTLINPRIIAQSDNFCTFNEGCLSIPGEFGVVKRPQHVKVKAQDRDGNWFEVEGEGLTARAFCHELDHLEGTLFVDRASRMLTNEELKELGIAEDAD